MRPTISRAVITALALTAGAQGLACGPHAHGALEHPARDPHPQETAEHPHDARARLLVLIVYDQVGSWVLDLHAPYLDPEGAVAFVAERGLHVERARYAYAGTLTAPGHVAIVSGASPSESGVTANRVWECARRARVSSFDDGVHPILEREGGHAGLGVMRTEVVADRLHAESSGRARIVALGMKDRSALPPGGHHPTLTLWFDPLADGFTTTSALRDTLPAWVLDFRSRSPWRGAVEPWLPLRSYDELGPDAQPGEGSYGLDASFPHDAAALLDTDIDAFLALPSSSAYLLSLAERAVREEGLGVDEIPDFLSISIAGTDYVGHGFGPESWEARDQLVRVDAMLGRWLRRLATQTELAVVITADHGVAPLPERAEAHGLRADARRIASVEELALLRAHLDATLGPREGGWVEAWVVPWISLSDSVGADPSLRARAIEAIEAHLRARPGIGFVVDRLEGAALRESDDETLRAIGLSIDARASGDLYVLPSEGSVADDHLSATGTGHGSPYAYDRDVPVLVCGPGVAHGRVREVVPQGRVAATLAHLLGVSAPHPGHAPLLGAP